MADNQDKNKGFASMFKDKVSEIVSKRGHTSAEKAGHEGMAERGRKGGEAKGSHSNKDYGEEE